MKILFVTGDDDCDCKGEGKVDKTGKRHPSEQFNVCLCGCVEAAEATVKTFEKADPYTTVSVFNGTVVPK